MARKTRTVAALLSTLPILGLSAAVDAQALSAEQQEVWDVVVACHDGWSESMATKDFDAFAKACPEEPGAHWWYTGGPLPLTYGGPDGLWQRSAPQTKSATWSELEPAGIDVFGDVALVYFSVVWTFENVDGQTNTNTSRRLSVLRRGDEGWKLVGGSVAGVQ